MDDRKQARFGSGGELQTDESDDTDDSSEAACTDFGDELAENETKSGVNRYTVSSLLQKAVRRSDEETAAWAAWELVRSGYAWNFWDRINLYVVEDLRAGHDVALVVSRYEELARERWSEDSWRGRLCAVHAALAAARAPSSRESAHADDFFSELSDERASAREEGREPRYEHPADELEPDGKYDVAFDQHTYEGTRLGRDGAFFRTHGARVGPDGEPELSRQWRLQSMQLEDREYTEEELARAVRPVDPADKWSRDDELRQED
ncbi:hypothetical protein [Natronorubrum bangense]|uniref:MgsA AAA+ ATPase C-terminal domain-containing protein n=2 Tax=Natronorubrum bangense TaxID=61858 RepID=L9WAI5_9EURY|nr:hypothetical protein [Natronorubrum bangense]ELY46485.1 hypothetical protein C494_14238 [Natronorubrum bangense JCM 10635]QCC56362.1 hypothetical protein DV706_17660 [Natronorubrum bangense]